METKNKFKKINKSTARPEKLVLKIIAVWVSRHDDNDRRVR